jgi:RimJ/RimL family protein N-acetyltransferase
VLAAEAWGKGYATEAAVAMLEFAGKSLGFRRVVATCRPENTGSIRVLEKAGLRRAALLPGHKVIDGQARDSLLFTIDL